MKFKMNIFLILLSFFVFITIPFKCYSLDTKSERHIQDAIVKIVQETTIIVIAHRLSTILKADQIYVLEKGEIIENGVYKNLLINNGIFSQMVKAQNF